jgi:hypothetical protein
MVTFGPSSAGRRTIRIVSPNGRVISRFADDGLGVLKLEQSTLPTGLYFVNYLTKDFATTLRLLISK